MPKIKTKSSAKKRFTFTSTGKVKAGSARKKHGMVKRSQSFIRKTRGTTILSAADSTIVMKFFGKLKKEKK